MSTQDHLVIAGREFRSRLLTGTGKYDTFETMREALGASGSEIVTVAVRRIDLDAPGDDITAYLPDDVLLLPNTSGCETAEEAVRTARLARAGGLPDWVKLEVIPDPRYLLPGSGRDAARGRASSSRTASPSCRTCSRTRCSRRSSRRSAARR